MPLTRIKNTAIGDGGISTAKLADGAVTTVKVADSAVNSAKIGVDVIAAEDLAANSVTVSEITNGAVTSAKLDTNITIDGNLGVGESNPSFDVGNKGIHIGGATSPAIRLKSNITGSGDWEIYADSASAGGLGFYEHQNNATYMYLSEGGKLGIGNTIPSSFYDGADNLVVGDGSGNSGISLYGGTSGVNRIYFADGASGAERYDGYIEYSQSSRRMLFGSAAATRMVIDSSGNLLVDKTSSNYQTVGHELRDGGRAFHTTDGGKSLSLNRLSSDGGILDFYKDGTEVGSIGVSSGTKLYVGAGDAALRFDPDNNVIRPHNASTNGSTDATLDIGTSTNRFKDLYLSGGVYLGGTGSANHLVDYEEGTWTPTIGGNATYYNRAGYYIKIGQLVFITGICHVNSVGTGANNNFQGLPFGGVTGVGREAFIGVQYFNNLNVSATYFALRVNGVQLYGSMQGGADGVMSINPAFITAATEVAFAGCYYTTG